MTIDAHPIRRPKLFELVADELEKLIHSGQLKPGDALPSERDMMNAFKTGRPAVREALFSLQNRGLIAIEAGRRARVVVPRVENVLAALTSVVELMLKDDQSLRHLHDARTLLEAAVARQAAKRPTKAFLDELAKVLAENEAAIGNRDAFRQSDIAFHRALFRATSNPVFLSAHVVLVNWLMDRWGRMPLDAKADRIAYKGHAKVFAAIRDNNPDKAEASMTEHLQASWRVWGTYQPR